MNLKAHEACNSRALGVQKLNNSRAHELKGSKTHELKNS